MVKLTNLHLQQVLARQRRDYGIDEETFPQQYPVEEQASNIDDTPVHNTGMERQCGKVDYRLQQIACSEQIHRSAEMSATEGWPQSFLQEFTGQQLWLKERWSFYGVSRPRPTLQGGPLRSRRWGQLCKGVH